jgi:alkylated DNA repair dioxygenase AlkB
MGPVTRSVLEEVNQRLVELYPSAPPFNHVLFNLYRDGRDGMGLHSDDEAELGNSPWIGSLSLGATRTFVVQPKKKLRKPASQTPGPPERHTLELDSGSLLFMVPPMQQHYLHGLPKVAAPVQQRLNLTFRHVLAERRPA